MRGASRRCPSVSIRWFACVAAALTLLASRPALAQSDEDRSAARAAATAGATAFDEGKWAASIELFTRAESLVHAPPHLLFIARSYVKLNRLVRARENYLRITREPLATSAPKAFAEARAAATTESAALEGRIPTVDVIVEGAGASDAVVTMDGSKVISGVKLPVDPGAHKFVARTKDQASDETAITVAEASHPTLRLVMKPSAQTGIEDPAKGVVPAASGAPPGDRDHDSAGGTSGLRIASYVALGVGAVGLVVGSVFLAENRSKRDEAQQLCPDGRCPNSQRTTVEALDSDGDSAATASWIGYGVGGAGLIVGATLFVLSTKSPSMTALDRRPGTLRPIVGMSYWGVAGSF